MGLRPLVAVLLLLAAAPLVLADHTFSHRVYVVGRVVDAAGLPVPGVVVNVTFNFPDAGACYDEKSESTSDTGDFLLCRHAHALALEPNVTVRVAGASATRAIDPALRSVAIEIRLPGGRPRGSIQGDRAFNSTFHVAGRVFDLLAEPVDVENVRVNATPRAGANVSVTVGDAPPANATVDEFGNYALDVPFGVVPPGAEVTVRAAGSEHWTAEASPTFRRADVDLVREAPAPAAPRPGSGVGRVPLPDAALTVAAASVACAALARSRPRRP